MHPQYITLPKNAKDITNERFGRLIALGPIGRTNGKQIQWLCQCDCGNETAVSGIKLRNGHTQSCGCLARQRARESAIRHGMTGTWIHRTWKGMNNRCANPANPRYSDWGGRGISVCDEWRHDFQAFYNHVSALPNFGKEGYTLDRIDNSLGYEPGNVKWSTGKEQARNSRKAVMITYRGRTQNLSAWSEELGIPYDRLHNRIANGWPTEKAFTEPGRFD